LKCIYCHHEGELLPGGEIPGDMVVSIAKAAAELGMRSVKLTGGEPLLRKDLDLIVARIPQSLDISITTNGILLAERAEALARAGLDRVNVSLDSLQPNRYCQITGGSPGDLEKVLAGIDASREADLLPIKLNFVVLKRNESEVPEMIDFCRRRGLILQLIELLDIQGQGISGDIEGIERSLAAQADSILTREMHRRKKYFLDGAEVEVVRPMDNTEFCAHCTRLRVTSDGKIKPCLLRSDNLVKIDSCDPVRVKELLRMANARREPYFGNVCRPVADAPFIESKII
jgi:cyclic pyranopterin phosphate synthase